VRSLNKGLSETWGVKYDSAGQRRNFTMDVVGIMNSPNIKYHIVVQCQCDGETCEPPGIVTLLSTSIWIGVNPKPLYILRLDGIMDR
jgi:hypothetical protein